LQDAGNFNAIINLIETTENDGDPISSVYDARWSLEMIHGAYASQILQKRVALPLEDRTHPLEKLRL